MRDVLEQRGLLSRGKERGRPFRIPLVDIRKVEEAMRQSLDATRVAARLGTTVRVVAQLVALGVLKPCRRS